MSKYIPPHRILQFANDHADVQRMVREQSSFHLGWHRGAPDTARRLLTRYVAACDEIGARPFNEHWLAEANRVVAIIEGNHRAAVARVFGPSIKAHAEAAKED